jgi:hypothetical protein
MNLGQTMVALERAGSEANRKVWMRHGAAEPMFGVSYATLYALQKQIGVDQRLAEALWNTENHDARVLATLIADGDAMTAADLNRWRRAATHRFLAMAFSSLAARSRSGLVCALRWIDGWSEFEQAAGWGTLAGLATGRAVADDTFAALLSRIERTIHTLPNYARYSANNCLIAIGSRPGLAAEAMRIAKAIGRVAVDHGDSQCKTPEASAYIDKVAKRRAANGKAANGKAAKKPKRAKKPAKKPAKKAKRAKK